jgi:hypothetical protein
VFTVCRVWDHNVSFSVPYCFSWWNVYAITVQHVNSFVRKYFPLWQMSILDLKRAAPCVTNCVAYWLLLFPKSRTLWKTFSSSSVKKMVSVYGACWWHNEQFCYKRNIGLCTVSHALRKSWWINPCYVKHYYLVILTHCVSAVSHLRMILKW